MIQLSAHVASRTISSPIAAGERIAKKFVDIHDWAQASLAAAKGDQERRTNLHRDAAPSYKTGGKVRFVKGRM